MPVQNSMHCSLEPTDLYGTWEGQLYGLLNDVTEEIGVENEAERP
jgi:hypothetical protein